MKKIGITCYPAFGGSGVVATELGIALARGGDEVHFISYALPSRLGLPRRRVFFHEVVAPTYPLFVSPPYTLALATKMAEVAQHAKLDLLHVHYALPHAISAILARDMGLANGTRLKVVTTLHGTDITIVGLDRSYLPITRYGIRRGGVTAVSKYLRDVTLREFGIQREVHVIPNFVDGELFKPGQVSTYAQSLCKEDEAVLIHISNFRPVKRIADVLGVFDRVRREIPARLLLIGDGPDRSLAERIAIEKGFEDRTMFLGNVPSIETILPIGKLFLLLRRRVLRPRRWRRWPAACRSSDLRRRAARGRRMERAVPAPVGDVEGMAQRPSRSVRSRQARAFSGKRAAAPSRSFQEATVARYQLYEDTLAG